MSLPPEILGLVVDVVSAEFQTMKTFSLVSRSFHSRARIHLFSQVILWVGTNVLCRKRALEFLRILKFKKNLDLISRIRSVIVLVQAEEWDPYDVEPDGYPLGSKGFLKLVGVDTDPIKTALSIFKTAPIEEFVLNASDGNFFYNRTTKLLFEICSNPNLKTLSFECIDNLPYRFIMGNKPAQNLTRLALAQATISDDDFQVPTRTVGRTAAELETLELVQMTSNESLKALIYISQRRSSIPLRECFTNLKNLVITLSQAISDERKEMWNMILGAAETLESLELRLSTAPPDSDPLAWDIRPLRLDSLKSLQQLRIVSVDYWRRGYMFRNELITMEMILATCGFQARISSVFLGTSFGAPQDRWQQFTNPSIITSDRWLPIDEVLAGPKFMDLRTVEVTVNGFFPRPGHEGINFTTLLPAISSNPRILLITSTTPPPPGVIDLFASERWRRPF